MQKKVYIGTHNGVKRGKTFQSPCAPCGKALARLLLSKKAHERALASSTLSQKTHDELKGNMPGSMKRPA